jgi:hypothetical protein
LPILQTLLELPLRYKLLAFATLVVLVELGFRRFGRDSQAYRRWTRFFEGIGAVWTVVILGVVYFTSVLLVSLVMRLLRTDLLGLRPAGASAWHSHEPNPLPPERAARHQF